MFFFFAPRIRSYTRLKVNTYSTITSDLMTIWIINMTLWEVNSA